MDHEPDHPHRPRQTNGHVPKFHDSKPDWCPACQASQPSELIVDIDTGDPIYIMYACGHWVNARFTRHEVEPPVEWTAENEETDYFCVNCGEPVKIYEVGEPCYDYGVD